MVYYIDQSGKVEDTNKLTVVAYANGAIKSIKIGSVEKRKLITALRVVDGSRRTYIFKIFAALVYLLLEKEKLDEVIIDHEYSGHESIIKGILMQLLNKNGKHVPEIKFEYIGKSSAAHKAAIDVFRGDREADLIIMAKDVWKVLL